MKLPTYITFTCKANDVIVEGLFVSLMLRMSGEEDICATCGPTDFNGQIGMPWGHIEADSTSCQVLFLNDHPDIDKFTGKIIVRPMVADHIEHALHDDSVYNRRFPPRTSYRNSLLEAKHVLEQMPAQILTVEVEHDGEGLTVFAEVATA